MSKIKRFLLIVMIILIIFSMIGCDTKEGGTTSTTGGIDTPKEKIGQTDFSSKADWESYLSE